MSKKESMGIRIMLDIYESINISFTLLDKARSYKNKNKDMCENYIRSVETDIKSIEKTIFHYNVIFNDTPNGVKYV